MAFIIDDILIAIAKAAAMAMAKNAQKASKGENTISPLDLFAGMMGGGDKTIQGGTGGINTGIQQTPMGEAPTWSPYKDTGELASQDTLASAFKEGFKKQMQLPKNTLSDNTLYQMGRRGVQRFSTPQEAQAATLPTNEEVITGRNIVVPGPGGQLITSPEVGQTYPSMIPERYRNLFQPETYPTATLPAGEASATTLPTKEPYPGFFAGLKEGSLGIPSTAGAPSSSEIGRQTAYYLGKLIPDIIRSRVGVPTAGAEAGQQQQLESNKTLTKLRKKTFAEKGKPSAKSLLQMAQAEAFKRMGGGILGQATMTTKEGQDKYLKMVNELYQEYIKQFGVSEGDFENINVSEEPLSYLDTSW